MTTITLDHHQSLSPRTLWHWPPKENFFASFQLYIGLPCFGRVIKRYSIRVCYDFPLRTSLKRLNFNQRYHLYQRDVLFQTPSKGSGIFGLAYTGHRKFDMESLPKHPHVSTTQRGNQWTSWKINVWRCYTTSGGLSSEKRLKPMPHSRIAVK